MTYTLTYSEQVKGWPSFYSYYPDWIIGMNNFLYTFKGGDLYKHNTNANRNTFYQEYWNKVGTPANSFAPTVLKSVFNDVPLENKLFKTLNLEGDATWNATMITDIQNSGFIDAAWFEKKEQSYYAFVRNNSNGQLALRSLNGIGRSILVVNPGTNNAFINFSINPLVDIGSIISIGDYVYFGTSTPILAGPVLSINVNLPAGINQIEVNNNMLVPLTTPIPSNTEYFLYIKNSVAESHGVLGHYCVFTLENYQTDKIELFAAETEVMKSFP
jgi:hypothetical protein